MEGYNMFKKSIFSILIILLFMFAGCDNTITNIKESVRNNLVNSITVEAFGDTFIKSTEPNKNFGSDKKIKMVDGDEIMYGLIKEPFAPAEIL